MAMRALAGEEIDAPLSTTLVELTEDFTPGPDLKPHVDEYVVPPADWLDLSIGQTWTTGPGESGHQHEMTLVKVCPAD